MRKLLTLLAASVVLFGIYAAVFGMPDRIATLVNIPTNDAESSAVAGDSAPARGQGGRSGGGNRSTTVVTVPLELQPYETVLNAIGTASALRSADVVSDAAGEVIEINLTPNAYVEADAVLVRLDSRTARLNLEIAQTQLDQAIETLARYERLRSSGSSTITDVTFSEASIAQRLATANVGLAQVALDNRTVRAPIAGKLGLSDVNVGDLLGTNDVIVTIDDDEALLIEFELPERAISILGTINTVLVSTPSFNGRNFEGEVVSFDSRLDSVTRSVTVNARIDNTNGELWSGMTFSVRIVSESEPLPAVPSTAITWSRTGSSLWINAEGVAKQVPVTILFRRDNTVWITGDLPTGTPVITEGAQKLRDGSQITTPDATPRRPAERSPDTARSKPARTEAPT